MKLSLLHFLYVGGLQDSQHIFTSEASRYNTTTVKSINEIEKRHKICFFKAVEDGMKHEVARSTIKSSSKFTENFKSEVRKGWEEAKRKHS